MNNNVVKVVLFLGGSVLGFLTGKVIYTKYYENLINTEINSVKEAYNAISNIKNPDYVDIDDLGTKEIKNKIERTNNFPLAEDGDQYKNTMVNYGITHDDNDEGDQESYDDEEVYGEKPVINPVPYLIDENSFTYDFDQHDKLSLDFYTIDKALVDDMNEKIDKPTIISMIGISAHTILCGATKDTILYVRNERLGIDYEIGTVYDSYEESLIEEEQIKEELKNKKKNLTPKEEYELKQKELDRKKRGDKNV